MVYDETRSRLGILDNICYFETSQVFTGYWPDADDGNISARWIFCSRARFFFFFSFFFWRHAPSPSLFALRNGAKNTPLSLAASSKLTTHPPSTSY